MTVTRKELGKTLSEKASFSAERSEELIDEVFDIMQEALERGEKIKIAGFGNFIVRQKRARKGRNPKTGEPLEISARRAAIFKPSLILRKALNKGSR